MGLVGYGLAGRVLHAPLATACPEIRLSAVVVRNEQRRAQAQHDHPDADMLDDVDTLLARSDELDLVVVASPNDSHAPIAVAAIDAGLAVVVDKPIAITSADAQSLVDHAAERGAVLTVFQNRRWDSDQLTLRRLVETQMLGDVLRHESRFERWRPVLETGKWRQTLTAAQGGGLVLDLGSHLVDQAVHLFGPVTSVYAEVDARRGAGDDDVFIALHHASGTRSHLWAGAFAGAPGPRRRVLGTSGAYVVEPLDGQEEQLRAGRSPRDPGFGEEPAEKWGRIQRGSDSDALPTDRGRWDLFYPAVVRAVRDRTPVPVDPHDAVRVLQILEAARVSNDEARVVSFSYDDSSRGSMRVSTAAPSPGATT